MNLVYSECIANQAPLSSARVVCLAALPDTPASGCLAANRHSCAATGRCASPDRTDSSGNAAQRSAHRPPVAETPHSIRSPRHRRRGFRHCHRATPADRRDRPSASSSGTHCLPHWRAVPRSAASLVGSCGTPAQASAAWRCATADAPAARCSTSGPVQATEMHRLPAD